MIWRETTTTTMEETRNETLAPRPTPQKKKNRLQKLGLLYNIAVGATDIGVLAEKTYTTENRRVT